MEPTTCGVYSHTLVSLCHNWLQSNHLITINKSYIIISQVVGSSSLLTQFLYLYLPYFFLTAIKKRFYLFIKSKADLPRVRYENLVGATFSPQRITAWFGNYGYHDSAIALALANNALLRALAPGTTLRVVNHPLPYSIENLVCTYISILNNQLQGRQREPSVKTLRSPLSAEFCRHCVFSGRTQRRALPRHQSEEMKI